MPRGDRGTASPRRRRVNHPFYSLSLSLFSVSVPCLHADTPHTHTPLPQKFNIELFRVGRRVGSISVVSVGNSNDRPTTMPSHFLRSASPIWQMSADRPTERRGDGEELCDCSVLPLFHSDGRSALPMTYLWSWARCVICEGGREERNAPAE